MKYKLLVLDVDGTLLNDAKEISKRTLASLLKVQQMGIRVALASGRPTYGLMPLAKMCIRDRLHRASLCRKQLPAGSVLRSGPGAVSYTHLDVYKRQILTASKYLSTDTRLLPSCT